VQTAEYTKLFELRDQLHESPELSFEEFKTSEIIESFLNDHIKGIEAFKVIKPYKTSIVVEYKNADNKPFKLFRADMDALPVLESSDNPVISKNEGVMHACGHDIHMTVLCGLIARTALNMPKENVLFVFQPGEEGAGGAKKMIAEGVFDNYNICCAHALHVTDDHFLGEVASNDNILFAIPKEVNVEFYGSSAHAAFPEKGCDALAAAASFLTDLEYQIRRKINPTSIFLAHFGKITSGTARNIVSDKSIVEGTLRAFDPEVMEKGMEVVGTVATLAAQKFGCSAKVKTLGEYVEVRNTPELYKKLKNICEDTEIKCVCKNGELVGEDFGYFTKKFSGIMFWIGSCEEGKAPETLHSKTFFPSSKALVTGLEIMWKMLL